MRMYDIITKKKQAKPLSREEILYFVSGYTDGSIPDYQASALLMAICLRGMNDEETAYLTEAIEKSGNAVDLSRFGELSVDKHSTGGVGDKTTLIVAPIVASLGCKVAKMSGRGLGHTGGTVDKLESIKGYRSSLSSEEFMDIVDRVGVSVIGQSENLAPADKKIYALRDVTATVDSIPLIASSIMGKKLASGAHSIVLDVKFGSGAFMKTEKDAAVLAEKMVSIGKSLGRRVRALITDMNTPLGYAVGNTLEVTEAIEILKGKGPSDLREVCVELASSMVSLALRLPEEKAREKVIASIDSGLAYEKFKEWLSAHGACASATDFPTAKYSLDVKAKADGYIASMDTEQIGHTATELGAGRRKKGDEIDAYAGIILKKKTSDKVCAGDTLATLYSSKEETLATAGDMLESALIISKEKPEKSRLIYRVI